MLQAAKEFKIGRPQIFAGLMLLAFLAQGLWVAAARSISPLEYEYIASGISRDAGAEYRMNSPFTGLVASLPVHLIRAGRAVPPVSWRANLAIPRPWLLRLPFVAFGVWLGGALWWVARRLFDDAGGYVALGLYCSSPAMVKVAANIAPEILLAWSIFGMVYTAIGVAHTLYSPPRKWAPRIVILGLSIGFAQATALWSATLVLLAFTFMLYLAPGRRRSVLVVLLGASAVALLVFAGITWWMGGWMPGPRSWVHPQVTWDLVRGMAFAFVDGYLFPGMFVLALLIYGTWARARYFGNTAPLLTAFATVLLFALVLSGRIWVATLGLSFAFVFVGGVAADVLETGLHRPAIATLAAGFLLRIVLTVRVLALWIKNGI
jgi:hypothetical protein